MLTNVYVYRCAYTISILASKKLSVIISSSMHCSSLLDSFFSVLSPSSLLQGSRMSALSPLVSAACRLTHPWHKQAGPQYLSLFLQPQFAVLQPFLQLHPLVKKSIDCLTLSCTSAASQSILKPFSDNNQSLSWGRGSVLCISSSEEFYHNCTIQHEQNQCLQVM